MTQKRLLIGLAVVAGAALVYQWLGDSGPAASGAALADVRVPDLSGPAREGEALFNRSCAECHGANAAGKDGFAPPLVHKIYEPGHHGDAAFHLAAKNGARAHHWPFGDMPPVEGITEAEVGKVVTYVRELQRANGIH